MKFSESDKGNLTLTAETQAEEIQLAELRKHFPTRSGSWGNGPLSGAQSVELYCESIERRRANLELET